MKERILVVDDEIGIRDLLVDLLSPLGHVIDTAANGSEAVRKVSEETYRLILLDVGMPVMDGIEAYWHIQRIAPEVNVVFISGTIDEEAFIQRLGLNDRVFTFIKKPFDLKGLRSLVERLM